MSNRAYLLLLVVPVGAGLYAWFGNGSDSGRRGAASEPTSLAEPKERAPELPPNHPSMGDHPSMGAAPGPVAPSEDKSDEPTPTWKVPEGWQVVPNTSSMRLATYRVPRAKGDSDDGDVSVMRAGGGTEANLDRWAHQFQDASAPKRTTKTVRGLKVVIMEVSGSFGGGMMPGGPAADAKKNWALLGAVIETEGFATFIKLTGPAATVAAAKKSFDQMIDSITPAAK